MSIFSQIPMPKMRFSKFNLSFTSHSTMKAGYCYPTAIIECVPHDQFKIETGNRVNLQPLIAPIRTDINVFNRWFFVPFRILWDNYEEFFTGGTDGLSAPIKPYASINAVDDPFPSIADTNNGSQVPIFSAGSLSDFLNFPSWNMDNEGVITGINNRADVSLKYDLMPFKAYQLIWNEYFRDQNLSEEVDIHPEINGDWSSAFGTDSAMANYSILQLMTLRPHCWEKDLFTSALPWAQRGQVSALSFANDELPIKFEIKNAIAQQVIRNQNGNVDSSASNAVLMQTPFAADGALRSFDSLGAMHEYSRSSPSEWFPLLDVSQTHVVDTSGANLFSINALRLAAAVQRFLENNARAGSRFVEQIAARFGMRVPDYRLDRPEYLGGGMFPITVSSVLQTSSSDDTSPQANMAGHGIGAGRSRRIKYNVEEPGYLMCITYIQPRTSYYQGIPRMYNRWDKFDYFQPELQHLGEQEIRNDEIYFNGSDDDGTFGYTPRYAEYKFRTDEIHGDMRTNMAYWHMARTFSALPALNEEFVCAPPRKDVFAVSDERYDGYIVDQFNSIFARRPMSLYGTPSSII